MQHASTMCYEIPENVTCSLNVLRNREKLNLSILLEVLGYIPRNLMQSLWLA